MLYLNEKSFCLHVIASSSDCRVLLAIERSIRRSIVTRLIEADLREVELDHCYDNLTVLYKNEVEDILYYGVSSDHAIICT